MAWQPRPGQFAVIRAGVFLLCLLPAIRLIQAAFTGDFGPNPVEYLQQFTGTWTFNLLLATLAVTPLRTLAKAPWLLRLRRQLGLFSFFYASLHFLSFIGFDHAFDMGAMAWDVAKRPFVTAGFAAFLLLVPLAATSSNYAIRHLGGRRWQALHRAVYAVGVLACIHYFWLVKVTALAYPLIYAAILSLLLGWRIARHRRHRHRQQPGKVTSGRGARSG